MNNFEIQTWFSDHHDAEIDDIFDFAEKAAKYGNIRRLKFPTASYGIICVVWSGNKNVTDEELLTKIAEEW